MEPRRAILPPRLATWSSQAGPDERRTAIVRIGTSTDPDEAASRVADAGAEVQSKGPGSLVCVVTPDILRRLAQEPWVLAVEEPTRLFPRAGPSAPTS